MKRITGAVLVYNPGCYLPSWPPGSTAGPYSNQLATNTPNTFQPLFPKLGALHGVIVIQVQNLVVTAHYPLIHCVHSARRREHRESSVSCILSPIMITLAVLFLQRPPRQISLRKTSSKFQSQASILASKP